MASLKSRDLLPLGQLEYLASHASLSIRLCIRIITFMGNPASLLPFAGRFYAFSVLLQLPDHQGSRQAELVIR